jgi:hypothetical protein
MSIDTLSPGAGIFSDAELNIANATFNTFRAVLGPVELLLKVLPVLEISLGGGFTSGSRAGAVLLCVGLGLVKRSRTEAKIDGLGVRSGGVTVGAEFEPDFLGLLNLLKKDMIKDL